jgi:hypothetical protein
MNFFEFQSDMSGLWAGQNLWVYVAASIPLTLITLGAWYIFKLKHDKKRETRMDEEKAE